MADRALALTIEEMLNRAARWHENAAVGMNPSTLLDFHVETAMALKAIVLGGKHEAKLSALLSLQLPGPISSGDHPLSQETK